MPAGVLLNVSDAHRDPIIDTLRISDSEVRKLLTALDAAGESATPSDSRNNQRVNYRCREGLVVRIHHPGGSVANFLVRPRNLSRTGLGFLHGSFVYTQTPCSITLPAIEGPAIRIEGHVVRCCHVKSNVHEIGLRFDEPIALDRVVPIGRYADLKAKSPPKLCGRVVCLDDNIDDREFGRFLCEAIGLRCEPAQTVEQVVARVRQHHLDLVLADPNLSDKHGKELVGVIRRAGFTGPMIAMTADDSEGATRRVIQAGFSGVLVKPFTQDTLEQLVRQCLPGASESQQVDQAPPLWSELWSNEKLRPLILGFLSRLDAQVQLIQDRLDEDPGHDLLKACLELKGTAGNLGFPTISAAAQSLHRLCTDGSGLDACREQADELSRLALSAVKVCDRRP